MGSAMFLPKKKAEIAQAQVQLLKRIKGNEELEMTWCGTCADLPLFKFKRIEREKTNSWQKRGLCCRVGSCS